jgi:signal-transduction protein with cAMP-binding, CBS, and nucleotidyltransferase domain
MGYAEASRIPRGEALGTAGSEKLRGGSFGFALLMMHENGFRHVSVIENGRPIGIVSARNALDPDMEEFVSEAQRRKHIR